MTTCTHTLLEKCNYKMLKNFFANFGGFFLKRRPPRPSSLCTPPCILSRLNFNWGRGLQILLELILLSCKFNMFPETSLFSALTTIFNQTQVS